MNVVLVDELVKALASLVEGANSVSCLETGPEFGTNYPMVTAPNIGLVIDAFSDLLSEGRDVSGVEVRSYRTPCFAEESWLVPQKGTVQILFGTARKTYHITIRQQSVHAQGGTPYGSQ